RAPSGFAGAPGRLLGRGEFAGESTLQGAHPHRVGRGPAMGEEGRDRSAGGVAGALDDGLAGAVQGRHVAAVMSEHLSISGADPVETRWFSSLSQRHTVRRLTPDRRPPSGRVQWSTPLV